MIINAPGFVAEPLQLAHSNAEEHALAAWKARIIVQRCAAHESFFSDYTRGEAARQAVVHTLCKPDALLWEVWTADKDAQKLDLCGILRLSEVVPRCTAKAHYFFFDGRLKDKTCLLQAWKAWAFSPTGGGLHRVTTEVPAYAKALGYHAQRHLGFGGPYQAGRLAVEGCMQAAIKWRGSWHDVYIMGCIADAVS